jgi:predicted RNA-binding protein with PUA-like domain
MQKGDRAFFYHSNCKNAGIVGTVVVTRKAQPDVTAYQDPNHPGYDPKSTADKCRWDSVEIEFDKVFPVIVTLKELKARAKTNAIIAQMTLLKNSRLSVHQLSAVEWSAVDELVDEKIAGETFGES